MHEVDQLFSSAFPDAVGFDQPFRDDVEPPHFRTFLEEDLILRQGLARGIASDTAHVLFRQAVKNGHTP